MSKALAESALWSYRALAWTDHRQLLASPRGCKGVVCYDWTITLSCLKCFWCCAADMMAPAPGPAVAPQINVVYIQQANNARMTPSTTDPTSGVLSMNGALDTTLFDQVRPPCCCVASYWPHRISVEYLSGQIDTLKSAAHPGRLRYLWTSLALCRCPQSLFSDHVCDNRGSDASGALHGMSTSTRLKCA